MKNNLNLNTYNSMVIAKNFSSTHTPSNQFNVLESGWTVASLMDPKITYMEKNRGIYETLDRFLETRAINEETQAELEEYLHDQEKFYTEGKVRETEHFRIFTTEFNRYIVELKDTLRIYIRKRKEIINPKRRADQILLMIINELKVKGVVDTIIHIYLKIVNTYARDNTYSSTTQVTIETGKALRIRFLSSLYKRETKEKRVSLTNWKATSEIAKEFEEGGDTLLARLGSKMTEIFEKEDALDKVITTHLEDLKLVNTYILPNKVITMIQKHKHITVLPLHLPMITEPKPYGKGELGGYLMNDIITDDPLIIQKTLSQSETIIENEEIYNTINELARTKFKINSEMLTFILENEELLELPKDPTPLRLENKKPTKTERIKLDELQSKYDLRVNIIEIAKIYNKIPHFYLPVRMDSRGRVYCSPHHLNYQSSDLAKSLLLFADGGELSFVDKRGIQWMEIYGANVFGNKLDKDSFEARINWVHDNKEGILNYTNTELIQMADNKLLFTAFCMEYKRYNEAMNSGQKFFTTHLPIQLDATCNAYQHLALLTKDNNMAITTNLGPSDWKTKPNDFYNFIKEKLKTHFQKIVINTKDQEKREQASRILSIDLQRSHVKPPIMTYVYNATLKRMSDYIRADFIREKHGEKEEVFRHSKNPNSYLLYPDFIVIAKAVKEVVQSEFPKIAKLTHYLEKYAQIMTLLSLPIPWVTPSGLNIQQSYIQTKAYTLRPFTQSKRTITLHIRDPKGKLNRTKQINALMPNLIHSLDAASLTLLLKKFNNKEGLNRPIYTIHDCFAVTANDVEFLVDELKKTFIHIYSNVDYLVLFDKNIRRSILAAYPHLNLDEPIKLDHWPTPLTVPNIKLVIGSELNIRHSVQNSCYPFS